MVIQTFSYNHWLARFRLGPLHSSASPLHLSGLVCDALLLWGPHLGVMPALSPAALRVNDASLLSLGRLVFSPEPLPAFLYPEGQAHRWCHEYCMMKMISLCHCIRAAVQILAKQGLLLLSPGPQTCHKITLKLLPFLIAQRLLIAGKFADASARGTIYCSTQRWPIGQRAGWACCSHGRMFSESFPEGTRCNSVFTAYAVYICVAQTSAGGLSTP